jgi:hypothetical protein
VVGEIDDAHYYAFRFRSAIAICFPRGGRRAPDVRLLKFRAETPKHSANEKRDQHEAGASAGLPLFRASRQARNRRVEVLQALFLVFS